MSKTATLVKGPFRDEDPLGIIERIVWLGSNKRHLVTVSVANEFFEGTYAFECDENGEVFGYAEKGSASFGDHSGAMTDAGYEIKESK